MKKKIAAALLAMTLVSSFSYAGIDILIPKCLSTPTKSTGSNAVSSTTSTQSNWTETLLSFWSFLFY